MFIRAEVLIESWENTLLRSSALEKSLLNKFLRTLLKNISFLSSEIDFGIVIERKLVCCIVSKTEWTSALSLKKCRL